MGLAQSKAGQARDGVGNAISVGSLAFEESGLDRELVLGTDVRTGRTRNQTAQAYALRARKKCKRLFRESGQ